MDMSTLAPGKLETFENLRVLDALYPNTSFAAALEQHLAVRGGCSLMDEVQTPLATPFPGLIDDSMFAGWF